MGLEIFSKPSIQIQDVINVIPTPSSISYCRKVNEKKLQKMRNQSDVMKMLIQKNNGELLMLSVPKMNIFNVQHQAESTNNNSSDVSQTNNISVNLPSDDSSIDLPVDLTVAKLEQFSQDESMFDYSKISSGQASGASASSNSLPSLPNEQRIFKLSPIIRSYLPKKATPVNFRMFIVPDNIDENSELNLNECIECNEIAETLIVFLAEMFDLSDHPDLLIYKKDLSDPFFDILRPYLDSDEENSDYSDKEISTPSSSTSKRPSSDSSDKENFIPTPSTSKMQNSDSSDKENFIPSSSKRSRTPIVSSPEYFYANTTPSRVKKIKLEISEDEPNVIPIPTSQPKMIQIYVPTFNADDDEIVLGPNGTSITARQFNLIKWHSASTATRKLLGVIFSNEVLATHSLTGRPSPAFIGRERPLKQQLNPDIIKDIIYMVKTKTNGTDREIRAAITTKCADTAKMFRAMQRNNSI